MINDIKNELAEISPKDFQCDIFQTWGSNYLALAAGNYEDRQFNAMTVGWGFFGTMWGEPTVMVVVRPQRYTLKFLDEYSSFTLNAFPPEHREKLEFIGKYSGREMPEKLSLAGLTPISAKLVDAPTFREAELVIECNKIYRGKFTGKEFIQKSLINRFYPERDYHILFIGKVVRIAGSSKYVKTPGE